MIDINLLPPEYAPKKLVNLVNLAIIAIFFLVGLSLILSALKLQIAVDDYSARVRHLDKQIKEYKPLAEAVHKIQGRIRDLKPRLSLAKDLLQERATWSDKLVELYECLPQDGIWINGLIVKRVEKKPGREAPQEETSKKTPQKQPSKKASQEEKPEPIIVQILGNVVSVDRVSEFVASLEESETFSNVVFDSATSEAPRPGIDSLISFKLTVQITPPKERGGIGYGS